MRFFNALRASVHRSVTDTAETTEFPQASRDLLPVCYDSQNVSRRKDQIIHQGGVSSRGL